MSTTSRIVLATLIAGIVAVFTGAAVGFARPALRCAPVAVVPSPATPATPTTAPTTPGRGLAGPEAPPPGGASALPGNTAGTQTPASGAEAKSPTGGTAGQSAAGADCVEPGFRGFPALIALVGGLVAALAGVLVMALTGGRRARQRPVSPAPVASTADPAVAVAARNATTDRAALIQACIYVRDRTTSKALAERLGATLTQVGVTAIEPTGARFDPSRHEAGGATHTSDPAKVGTIAAVEVPGYADRGKMLRAPVVTVYQASEASKAQEER